jgi:hypothetical protein
VASIGNTESYGAEDENAYDSIFSRNVSDMWLENSQIASQRIDFGRKHPNYKQPQGKKARWTEEELNFLQKWMEENPDTSGKRASKCLEAIYADPKLHPIFHMRHVVDTARLRDGFEALNRRESLSPEKKRVLSVQRSLKRQQFEETFEV